MRLQRRRSWRKAAWMALMAVSSAIVTWWVPAMFVMLLKKLHGRACRVVIAWSVTFVGALCILVPVSALPAKTPTIHLAGVALGMTKKQVHQILGAPTAVRHYQFEPGVPD